VRVAVVGHIELVDFLTVERLPAAGEVAHADGHFRRTAGGGGVAAAVLAELGAHVELYCALGDDHGGALARDQLHEYGCRAGQEQHGTQDERPGTGSRSAIAVHAAIRPRATRRALALLARGGDRAIVTLGERLQPSGSDPLPWELLDGVRGAYFTAGDRLALAHARRARVLVATPRAGEVLADGPRLDALVWSARDAHEQTLAQRLAGCARLLIETDGERGGRWWGASAGSWPAVAPSSEVLDSYGAGDAFAAAVTFALAGGAGVAEAVALGARWGTAMLTRAGAP
jgi:ribokinase